MHRPATLARACHSVGVPLSGQTGAYSARRPGVSAGSHKTAAIGPGMTRQGHTATHCNAACHYHPLADHSPTHCHATLHHRHPLPPTATHLLPALCHTLPRIGGCRRQCKPPTYSAHIQQVDGASYQQVSIIVPK